MDTISLEIAKAADIREPSDVTVLEAKPFSKDRWRGTKHKSQPMGDWLEIEELESERFILLPGWWTGIKKMQTQRQRQSRKHRNQSRKTESRGSCVPTRSSNRKKERTWLGRMQQLGPGHLFPCCSCDYQLLKLSSHFLLPGGGCLFLSCLGNRLRGCRHMSFSFPPLRMVTSPLHGRGSEWVLVTGITDYRIRGFKKNPKVYTRLPSRLVLIMSHQT